MGMLGRPLALAAALAFAAGTAAGAVEIRVLQSGAFATAAAQAVMKAKGMEPG